MIEITVYGRGGQGCVTCAEVLAIAGFKDGKKAQAFPAFGVERTGAPIRAFCRFDDKPIRLHQHVYSPDYAIVLDDTLSGYFDDVKKGGTVLIATKSAPKPPEGVRVVALDAYEVARKAIGRPIVNVAVLGAFAKATGLVTKEALEKAILERFPKELAEKNIVAMRNCYSMV
ncbi:pyruvate ferredoxin oxidoreductase [Candidatus Micrarchaeota archaeon CG08_land_8_20_14_0_20_59_11]|nr:MAG: pyruvate ferredoxin oxidoreductase [Candidatus Micrarchaeota archaeon CG08_land_8_20_14_0_20_59_11]